MVDIRRGNSDQFQSIFISYLKIASKYISKCNDKSSPVKKSLKETPTMEQLVSALCRAKTVKKKDPIIVKMGRVCTEKTLL